jgi:regulator of replication initiation timing
VKNQKLESEINDLLLEISLMKGKVESLENQVIGIENRTLRIAELKRAETIHDEMNDQIV